MSVKRKLSDIDSHNPIPALSLKKQRKYLLAALTTGRTSLFRALRLARGFERQKLGRRQKSSKTKKGGKDDERLDAEVLALKNLDLEKTAEGYLCRTLVKTKAVAEHAALSEEVRVKGLGLGAEKDKEEAGTRGGSRSETATAAEKNVVARLCMTGPVVKAMENVMLEVRRALGLGEEEVRVKKRLRKADFEAAKNGVKELGARTNAGDKRGGNGAGEEADLDHQDDDESFAGFSDEGEGLARRTATEFNSEDEDDNRAIPAVRHGSFNSEDEDNMIPSANDDSFNSEDEDEDGINTSQYDSRLASDSDEDEPSDVEIHKLYAGGTDPKATASTRSASVSLSPEPASRKALTGSKLPSDLPFLQSGYISGSDSDASDVSVLAAPRKNRLGQRARQAKWEEKYGREAKHLQNGGKAQSRDAGWDARRGATDGNVRKPWERRRGGGGFAALRGSADRRPDRVRKEPEVVVEKVPTYGAAHPSWVAKQQAKERAAVAAKPAGKKITFD